MDGATMIEMTSAPAVDPANHAGSVYAAGPVAPFPWRPVTRVAFRFSFLYFTLYVVCTQMLDGMLHTLSWVPPNFGALPPVSTTVMWVIRHVFHDNRTLAMGGGSG